jgi:hypothetical protein
MRRALRAGGAGDGRRDPRRRRLTY